ncbi:MAG: winged helix-turn-helix domain-containing protein [bacterium]
MIAAGLREPIFEPDGFFSAIFHRSPELAMKEAKHGIVADGKQGKAKTAQKTTQKTTQKIIAMIQRNPEITRQELAAELGITDSGVKYHLKKMQDKGLLCRVGPDKGGYWKVVRQDTE